MRGSFQYVKEIFNCQGAANDNNKKKGKTSYAAKTLVQVFIPRYSIQSEIEVTA